jgi:ABC-type oligopeptide transport system substrate-binding subunit
MKKKVISIILVTVLAAALFAGCSKSDKDTADTKETANTADTSDTNSDCLAR